MQQTRLPNSFPKSWEWGNSCIVNNSEHHEDLKEALTGGEAINIINIINAVIRADTERWPCCASQWMQQDFTFIHSFALFVKISFTETQCRLFSVGPAKLFNKNNTTCCKPKSFYFNRILYFKKCIKLNRFNQLNQHNILSVAQNVRTFKTRFFPHCLRMLNTGFKILEIIVGYLINVAVACHLLLMRCAKHFQEKMLNSKRHVVWWLPVFIVVINEQIDR